MFRAVRCTTALLVVLAASACGTAPTAPAPAHRAPDSQALRAVPDDAIPTAKTSAECDPKTGQGCCFETTPWLC